METIQQQKTTQKAAIGSRSSVSDAAISHPSRTIVHAKLEMTEPGDHDEQEADAMASAIMSGGKISRKISNGASGSSGIAISQQMERQISRLQGRGQAMPKGLRNMMESSFGQDFSQVHLHTDSEAASMSSSIHAKAFTLGNGIYFNQGQYSPNTTEGQRLVAHELTHVVQGGKQVARQTGDPSDVSGTSWLSSFVHKFSPHVVSDSQTSPAYRSLDYSSQEDMNTMFAIIDALIDNDENAKVLQDQEYNLSNPKNYYESLVFIWEWLHHKGFSDDQSYAIMGNWDYESGLDPARVEGSKSSVPNFGAINEERQGLSTMTLTDLYFKNGKWQKPIAEENRKSLAGGGLGQWTGNRADRLSVFVGELQLDPKKTKKLRPPKSRKSLLNHIHIPKPNNPEHLDLPLKYHLIAQLAFAYDENRGSIFRPGAEKWKAQWGYDKELRHELFDNTDRFMWFFEGIYFDTKNRYQRKDRTLKIHEELRKQPNINLSDPIIVREPNHNQKFKDGKWVDI